MSKEARENTVAIKLRPFTNIEEHEALLKELALLDTLYLFDPETDILEVAEPYAAQILINFSALDITDHSTP